MFGDHDLSHWGLFFGGVAALVSSVAGIIAARRAKRAAMSAADAARQVRPSNGQPLAIDLGDRLDGIAEQVRGTSRVIEVLDGRTHDISKRVDAQGREIGALTRSVGELMVRDKAGRAGELERRSDG